MNQRVAGLIPSLGNMPGFRTGSPVQRRGWGGPNEKQPHTDASLPLLKKKRKKEKRNLARIRELSQHSKSYFFLNMLGPLCLDLSSPDLHMDGFLMFSFKLKCHLLTEAFPSHPMQSSIVCTASI